MEDRTLVEAAAKAAGYSVSFPAHNYVGRWKPSAKAAQIFWNPLQDDGDALRLATTLQINIEHVKTLGGRRFCISCYPVGRGDCLAQEDVTASPMAVSSATRRAIVRAAANLSKIAP